MQALALPVSQVLHPFRLHFCHRHDLSANALQRFTGVLISSMKQEEAFSSRKGRGSIFLRTAVRTTSIYRKSIYQGNPYTTSSLSFLNRSTYYYYIQFSKSNKLICKIKLN